MLITCWGIEETESLRPLHSLDGDLSQSVPGLWDSLSAIGTETRMGTCEYDSLPWTDMFVQSIKLSGYRYRLQ